MPNQFTQRLKLGAHQIVPGLPIVVCSGAHLTTHTKCVSIGYGRQISNTTSIEVAVQLEDGTEKVLQSTYIYLQP